jgi:hypothetical protein
MIIAPTHITAVDACGTDIDADARYITYIIRRSRIIVTRKYNDPLRSIGQSALPRGCLNATYNMKSMRMSARDHRTDTFATPIKPANANASKNSSSKSVYFASVLPLSTSPLTSEIRNSL